MRVMLMLSIALALSLLSSLAVGDELEELKRALRDDDDRDRRQAVSGLAELGGELAWELVIDALEDRSPMVADEAQLRLAGVPAALVPGLLGKAGLGSKRERVPLRAAELLGRLGDPGASKGWSAALRHKDEAVRRSLLWSVERQAREGRFGAGDEALIESVTRLAEKDKVPAVCAHALLALAELSPELARVRIDAALRASDVALRAAAVERLDLLPASERLAAARAAAEDEAPLVRHRGYLALTERGDRDGALALSDALEREAALRLTWRLVELLQDLSGMKYGADPRPWKRWAEALETDWTPADKRAEHEYGERSAAFVGMPILSGRIAFLIDFSGSMWEERSGKTRKEVVDVELRRALEALPETTEFNVHPYTGVPFRWQKKLVPARRKNVQKALDYFEGNKEHGKGNFWGAAMEALEDDRVDTLMVLTDGAPTGGYRWNVTLMKTLFAHENRFRGVFLDVLLVDTAKFLRGHWEEMCTATGGRCLAVEV